MKTMDTLWQDVRYGLRMLAKHRSFTIIAILTLALGIGANTAIFSVVNGVLLNPLPFPNPGRLVTLYERRTGFQQASIAYPNFLDWQRNNRSLSSIAAYRDDDFSLTGAGEAEIVHVEMISSNFFSILGVKPALGRTFTPEEDQLGAGPAVLISGGLWKRKFGSSPGVLGKSITLNGAGYTIVGVMPASFHLLLQNFRNNNDVYLPVGQWNDPAFRDRNVGEGLDAIGRLKPGVTVEQARADFARVTGNLAATFPDADKNIAATIVPLKEEMVGKIQPILWVLLGAVFFVLLIACVNVANLSLARSTGRAREFAIRAALGASQARVVRQLLTESILLAIAGGGLGLILAGWGTRAALSILPEALPRAEAVGVDAHVLLFTLFISILAGVVFGLAPALKTSRPDLQSTLKESGRGASGARHRAQGLFVVVEMALALVLLIGAGLMIRSMAELWSVNPGFNPNGVLTFFVSLSPSLGKTPAAMRSAFRELHNTLAAVPGVDSVALSGGPIPMRGDSEFLFWIQGHPKPTNESELNMSLCYMVEPDYLKVMGLRLERGRFLGPQDDENSRLVTVIDESFARKYFPNENPVGKRINIPIINEQLEIVGVVGHVKHWGLDSDVRNSIEAQFYLPFMQMPARFMTGPPQALVVVRSKGSPFAPTASIRNAIAHLNSENVMYGAETMDQVISDSLAARRFAMILLGVFAALALVLSSVGIYGVISYVVGQRTHEIGIRIALGAQRQDVLRLMLGEGMKMALIGVAVGLVAALGMTRLVAGMLYGVSPTDPLTFAGVALVLADVALAACYIPARRAMRVDPIVALRYE